MKSIIVKICIKDKGERHKEVKINKKSIKNDFI